MDRVHSNVSPFCVIHGDTDSLVPVDEARMFVSLLREKSREPVVYMEIPGAQHAFELFPSLRSQAVVDGIERFVAWTYSRYLDAREGTQATEGHDETANRAKRPEPRPPQQPRKQRDVATERAVTQAAHRVAIGTPNGRMHALVLWSTSATTLFTIIAAAPLASASAFSNTADHPSPHARRAWPHVSRTFMPRRLSARRDAGFCCAATSFGDSRINLTGRNASTYGHGVRATSGRTFGRE
jgi:hypothetical protein